MAAQRSNCLLVGIFYLVFLANFNIGIVIVLLFWSVKDSVVGEERIAQYLLAVLNTRGTPLHWKHLNNRRLEGIRYDSKEKHEYNLKDLRPKRRKPPNDSNMLYVEDLVTEVQCALYLTLLEFTGNVKDESDLEGLIEQQFEAL
nr:short integuments 2, mitochondrial [Quercus suber]